jgi:drug/metabolite transporter (DMT)-like permease
MWSLQFTCIKLTQDQVGSFSTVFIPILAAMIFMIPFVIRDARKNTRRKLSHLKFFAALAVAGQFPAQVLMTIGTQHSTATNAGIISLTLPIVSALMAVAFLKEKMNPLRWFSFAIAIAGVLMISLKDFWNTDFRTVYLLGNLLIFCGVIGSGLYNVLCKKIADSYSEIEMLFYTYIFMVIILFPLVWMYERNVITSTGSFTRNTWIGLILLTVFHNFLSMILFFTALKKLEAIQVALSNFLVAFFAIPIAAIWLGESMTAVAIIGGALVLISTLVITVVEYRRQVTTNSVGAS